MSGGTDDAWIRSFVRSVQFRRPVQPRASTPSGAPAATSSTGSIGTSRLVDGSGGAGDSGLGDGSATANAANCATATASSPVDGSLVAGPSESSAASGSRPA
jgi:hypothetical protein